MEWIDAKKNPPLEDCMCIVCNIKGWMYDTRALYSCKEGVFQLYDPNYRETLLLDVSHYYVMPVSPRFKDEVD